MDVDDNEDSRLPPLAYTYKDDSVLISSRDSVGSYNGAPVTFHINNGVKENFKTRTFDNEEEAKQFYVALMTKRNFNTALPLPIYQILGETCYNVAIPIEGITFKEFLSDASNARVLFDYVNDNKVQISNVYRKILRDIILALLNLEETNDLKWDLDMESVSLLRPSEEPLLNLVVRISDIAHRDDPAIFWAKSFVFKKVGIFVREINEAAGVGAVSREEFEPLIDMLCSENTNGILELPLFWDSPKRIDFICKLDSYLKGHIGINFCSIELRDLSVDWEGKVAAFRVLKWFKEQYRTDSKKLSLNVVTSYGSLQDPASQKLERGLREFVDFMRQCFSHFFRMKNDIKNREKEPVKIKSRFELQLLLEQAVPHHIAQLVVGMKAQKLPLFTP